MHLETRVLVTGGAGFIGSHLCERRLAGGASVVCVDSFFTGTRRNLDRVLLGRDITVYGDGQRTRSFCYVDDLIDGLVRLMASPDGVTGPINIGNPQEHSMLQLAQMVIDFTASRSRVAHRPLPEDDPRQRHRDISKANEVLSWSPKTPVHDGLIKTIAYFKELLRDQGTRALLLANA